MTLAERLLAVHAALDAHGVPHAFGGAIALAFWTEEPRGTRDLDVNAFVPASDAARVLAALPPGIDTDGAESVLVDTGQHRLWWDDTPVDLFLDYAPVHDAAARHLAWVPFEGTQIPVLGPVELAVFKAMFDRTKDWADIEAMIAAGSLPVDEVRSALVPMIGEGDPRLARLSGLSRP